MKLSKKIYNKKTFVSGLFFVFLGLLLLVVSLLKGLEWKQGLIAALCLVVAVGELTRSLSYQKSKADKIDERDERNRLIALKTKSRAFGLMQGFCFVLMLAFFLIGKLAASEQFISMGIGLAFGYGLSVFTEIFTSIYYEKRS